MAIHGLSESGSAAYLPDSAVLLRTRVAVRGPIAAGEPTGRALEDDDLSVYPDRDCLAQTNEDVDPGQDYDRLASSCERTWTSTIFDVRWDSPLKQLVPRRLLRANPIQRD